jgi:hypothetical protein
MEKKEVLMKVRGGRYIKIGNPYKSEARLDTKESLN